MALKIPTKITKEVRKSGIPKTDWDNLKVRLRRIAGDPYASHPDVERIKDSEDGFRVRRGDWRAIYVVTRDGDIEVVKVGKRGEVYRDDR